jgi:NAD(P)-dependent dehydrogenase (short-subunit alcohol dehydrogenase family)
MNSKTTILFMALILALVYPCLDLAAATAEPDYEHFMGSAGSETVIVTGSNRGLGFGWVKHYLQQGASVIATCRSPADAEALHELRAQYGARLLIEQLDVTDEESLARLRTALAKHGVTLDVAISNAGVTVSEPFGEWTKQAFETNIHVNTIGTALFAQMVAPQLKDGARLVNITSAVGSISRAKRDNPLDAYAVSKAGVHMLTRRLAVKLQDRGIVVVAFTPGRVLTDMNPNGIISVEESIGLMSGSLAEMTLDHSGKAYFNDGRELPW